MLTRTEVAAAAPAWVRDRLDGPLRDARIVHSGPDAIYADVGGACVGVLSRSAVAVPCGLQTTLTALPEVAPRDAATTATVGAGCISIGPLEVRVGRTVDAAVPTIACSVRRAESLTAVTGDRLDAVREELPAADLTALRNGDPAAVPALLGRGSGLTPVGDDVLCGWLATGRAVDEDTIAVSATIHDLADDRTTLLSATLLRRAVAGDVIPAFRRMLLALRSGADTTALRAATDDLLATGHTSGAGLLLGSTLVLDHVQRRRR